ncbi:Restriction endonuclease subunit S [Candidatus Electrothrix laxa]
MEDEWPVVRLGDHADLCLGKMLDKEKNRGEFFPYLGNKNVRWGYFDTENLAQMRFEKHEHERYGLKYGDLVVCEGGEPGRCAIWKDEIPGMRIQKALHRIRPHKELDNIFLHYWFLWSGANEALESFFTGTTIKHLSGKAVSALKIPLPPLPKQKAIAHILGSLDDKIQLNRQMNATLEAMAQALFKSWFVDFDPVIDKALAAGNPIPEPLRKRAEARQALGDKRKPLPADVAQYFPDRFVFNEELGWVPEGWEVSTIGDEVETVGGGTPSTKNATFWDGGVHPFCTPKDMSALDSIVLMDTTRYLTDAGVNKISSGQLPKDVVLMSSRAPIGYLAISDVPVSVNQGVIAMLPNSKYGPIYLLLWTHFNMGAIKDRANGSTFLEISKKNFRPIPFLVPTDEITDFFNGQAKGIYNKMLLLSEQIRELSTLRDTLLPKLLSGQLRIPNAENFSKDA